jgi:hypothetical protein
LSCLVLVLPRQASAVQVLAEIEVTVHGQLVQCLVEVLALRGGPGGAMRHRWVPLNVVEAILHNRDLAALRACDRP